MADLAGISGGGENFEGGPLPGGTIALLCVALRVHMSDWPSSIIVIPNFGGGLGFAGGGTNAAGGATAPPFVKLAPCDEEASACRNDADFVGIAAFCVATLKASLPNAGGGPVCFAGMSFGPCLPTDRGPSANLAGGTIAN
mmetsp:Transcript_11325/g.30406  ORF Transcript_11325/g.30406 Transcript_11325/m.30406 type:complete len:141 (-) Transcript_11325:110-532(-)